MRHQAAAGGVFARWLSARPGGPALAVRLFGHDVGIVCGAQPQAGARRAYAADLAHRLRQADCAVVLDAEAPALARCAALVMVVDAAVLRSPGELRSRFEAFRLLHPARPVLPIGLDDSLDPWTRGSGTSDWQALRALPFLRESGSAAAQGLAGEQAVQAVLDLLPRLRANMRWGALLLTLFLLLALGVGLAWNLKRGADVAREAAERQQAASAADRLAALMSLVAARQQIGEYASAATLAAAEPSLPSSFQDNARLARFESATVIDAARLAFDQPFDVDWLRPAGTGGQRLISRGWYSGVSTIEIGTPPVLTACDVNARAPEIHIAADGSWFAVRDPQAHQLVLLRSPDCRRPDAGLAAWVRRIAEREQGGAGPQLSSLLPLPGPLLLAGWTDGRVELHGDAASPRILATLDAGVAGLYASPDGRQFALLSRSGEFRLVGDAGQALAAALNLAGGDAGSTDDPAWRAFAEASFGAQPRALRLDRDAPDAGLPAVLAVVPQGRAVEFLLHRFELRDRRVLDVAVSEAPRDGCHHLNYLTPDLLVSVPIERRCRQAVPAGAPTLLPLPLPNVVATAEPGIGFAAGAFCADGSMVLGGWRGDLVWMRQVRHLLGGPPRVDIEHQERSWSDAATALACAADGTVHAGFRATGVKTFRARLRLQETQVDAAGQADYAQVIEEDRSWPVETRLGPAQLDLQVESGELGLLRQGRPVWRRQLIDPTPDASGTRTDKVIAVELDRPRMRAWVLTTLGRLSLIELETGAVLLRFSSAYYAGTPSNEVALQRPSLDDAGLIRFVHRAGERAFRVSVVDRGN